MIWDFLNYSSIIDPWLWFSLGVFLLILELLIPGRFVLSQSISALLIGGVCSVVPRNILTYHPWETPAVMIFWFLLSLLIWGFVVGLFAFLDREDTQDIAQTSSK